MYHERFIGGAEGNRTPDLVIANDALSQLSYGPFFGENAMGSASYGFAHPPVNLGVGAGIRSAVTTTHPAD